MVRKLKNLIKSDQEKKVKKFIKNYKKNNKEYIELNSDYIGRGNERYCFLHPNFNNKCIKIFHNNKKKSNNFNSCTTEFYFYNNCIKEENKKFFGKCYDIIDTSKGIGYVYELVVDDDNSISLTLSQYIQKYGLTNDVKQNIKTLTDMIIKNYYHFVDLYPKNILVKMTNNRIDNLVIVDYPDYKKLKKTLINKLYIKLKMKKRLKVLK
jgi:hypothetical protein